MSSATAKSPPYKGGVARSAGVVAHTETFRRERPPQLRFQRSIPSFVRRGLFFLFCFSLTVYFVSR